MVTKEVVSFLREDKVQPISKYLTFQSHVFLSIYFYPALFQTEPNVVYKTT